MVYRAEKIIRLAPKMRTCIHQYRRVRLFGTNRIILSALELMATFCRRERIYPFRYVIFCGMNAFPTISDRGSVVGATLCGRPQIIAISTDFWLKTMATAIEQRRMFALNMPVIW